jgi:predicted alpha/beta-fold hydrolase
MFKGSITTFNPLWYLFNNHLETIVPALFRKVYIKSSIRHRISTPDKDFIDIDYYDQGKKKTVILCHGLEGNSQKPYVKGMARVLLNNKFNCVAWNFRGCSGIPNKHSYSYHSGATEDLDLVVQSTLKKFPGTEIYLVGFSLGGNLLLKYLGERPHYLAIKKAVAISTPLELQSSCFFNDTATTEIYTLRFLYSLKNKIREKAKIFPEQIILTHMNAIKNIEQFDDQYTAPLHGFKNAMDYYTKCSSIHYLEKIRIPTLLINARNDPFLSDKCYPKGINEKYISCDYPFYGGHLGFMMSKSIKTYYHEIRSVEFFSK